MVNDSGAGRAADSVAVEFDDERLVANAGVLLTSTLIDRLGLERLVDRDGRPRPAPGRREAGPQGLLARPRDGAWGRFDRRLRPAARRGHRGAARTPRDGALDARHLPALVQLRACAPARSGAGGVDPASLVGRRGTRLRAPRDRHRLLHRRGARLRRSRAPASATPASAATTRSSPPARAPARCCTSACARDRRARDAARFASCRSWSPASVAPAPKARS